MEHPNSTTSFRNHCDSETALLFDQFRQGDVNAFSRLYDLNINMLFNYGCKLTNDMELLRDCVQDVFVKMFNKRNELAAVQNFKSYILISLKNKLCDEARRRTHYSATAVEEFDMVATENVEMDYLAAEKVKSQHSTISRLLDKLSPRQRQAIELYYIEEKKYEDICELLSMNYQSVRNLIHRGMSRLREHAYG